MRYSLFPVLVWLLTAYSVKRLGVRFGYSFYGTTYRRLREVVERMTGTTRVTRRSEGMSLLGGGWRYSSGTSERQHEAHAIGPDDVDQPLIGILEELGRDEFPLPGGLTMSLPSPDVIFVFDELDKAGLGQVLPLSGSDSATSTENEERIRTAIIHRLLSDLKNLLSTAPARFLFIGGRNLHDEWLADRTAPRPLLSNIFNAEVYIPSLLTDPIPVGCRRRDIANGVTAYVNAQFERAKRRNNAWLSRHHVFGKLRLAEPLAFVQAPQVDSPGRHGVTSKQWVAALRVHDAQVRDPDCVVMWGFDLAREFIELLTIRSRGNPKQLAALFENFVRPTGRVIDTHDGRWGRFDSCHVLYFGDVDRFRMGLGSELYRRLDARFGARLAVRDDKAIRSLLQIADFVMKFHRRAFSWSSLERIDELVHIHRVPDLRDLLKEMMRDWHRDYLHPILNGMYDFRFRSEMAAEIAYLSRRSEAEMAAYNFTLDESQKLKRQYRRRLAENRDPNTKSEMYDALGELHDLDQEYEQARGYYLEALVTLDRLHGVSDVGAVLGRQSEKIRWLRRHMPWCIARIRLLLQIGMTYERARDQERAMIEYRNARSVAHSVIFAFIDREGRRAHDRSSDSMGERIDSLKQLRVVYQPLFAEAWIAEKATSGVDTSASLVEREIWRLRCVLPFVRERSSRTGYASSPRHANFTLAMADLHARAGDLYFWKGKRPGRSRRVGATTNGQASAALARARYHYCVALHEVRRLHRHRQSTSNVKFWGGMTVPIAGGVEQDALPYPIVRRVASCFFALGETFLAMATLPELHYGDKGVEQTRRSELNQLAVLDPGRESLVDAVFGPWFDGEAGELRWLGHWKDLLPDLSARDDRLLAFDGGDSGRPAVALGRFLICSEIGAELLERAGAMEEAARARIRIAGAIDSILWKVCLARPSMWSSWQEDLRRFGQGQLERSFELLNGAGRLDGNRAHHSMIAAVVRWFALELCGRPLGARPKLMRAWLEEQGLTTELRGRMLVCAPLNIARGKSGRTRMKAKAGSTTKWAHICPRTITSQVKPPRPHGKKGKAKATESPREMLERLSVRYPYPMLTRLVAVRTLVFEGARTRRKRDSRWVEDLLHLEALYATPLHFTPLCLGTALGVWVLHQNCDAAQSASWAQRARQQLQTSVDLCTGQAAYYEMIADLHYLDDGFDDRAVRVQYALMQACSGFAQGLLMALDDHPSGRAFAPRAQS